MDHNVETLSNDQIMHNNEIINHTQTIHINDVNKLKENAEEQFKAGNHHEALNFYLQLKDLFANFQNEREKNSKEIIQYKNEVSFINAKIGICYFYLADYTLSIDHYFKALIIYEEFEDFKNISECNYYLSMCYAHRGDLDKALKYLENSLNCSLKIDDYDSLAKIHNAFGVTYLGAVKITEAEKHLLKSLEYSLKINNIQYISNATSNLGLVHMEKREFDKAIVKFLKSKKLEEQLNSKRGLAYINFRIAEAYMWKEDFQKSIQMAKLSLEMQKEMENKYQISNCYLLISHLYESMKNYKEALSYYKLHSDMQKELYTEDNNKKVAELEKNYKIYKEEKEKEIYKLKNEELKELNCKLKEAYENIKTVAIMDPLTTLLNRRGFLEKASELEATCLNKKQYFSVLILDLDNFKSINDTYEHAAGDLVLQGTSLIIKDIIGPKGIIARWGGEEFIILIPNCNAEQAISIAEHIRVEISQKYYDFNNNRFKITTTIGLSSSNTTSIDSQIRIADHKLYVGKSNNKNCVIYM